MGKSSSPSMESHLRAFLGFFILQKYINTIRNYQSPTDLVVSLGAVGRPPRPLPLPRPLPRPAPIKRSWFDAGARSNQEKE